MEDGYEFFAKRQLVTLFSAPNYCGEFDNAGGMMSVDETLMCSFQVIFQEHIPFKKLFIINSVRQLLFVFMLFSFLFLADIETQRKESQISVSRFKCSSTCDS